MDSLLLRGDWQVVPGIEHEGQVRRDGLRVFPLSLRNGRVHPIAHGPVTALALVPQPAPGSQGGYLMAVSWQGLAAGGARPYAAWRGRGGACALD